MKHIFNLLEVINKNPKINQRALSTKCKVSLGKVNSIIEDLENNKFIDKDIVGREHKYCITERGLNFLETELKENQNRTLNLHNDNNKRVNKAVILAAGRNRNFDIPVGLLKIKESILIERTIEILKNNGIKEIVVVVGYKADLIRETIGHKVMFVENSNYKWTGTMDSLSRVESYINDDFLLIESDIVVESAGIKGILDDKSRDCILITAESGSGDEAFVETRNKRVYKISKDIAQLNKIDGEMIGISKISYDFFKRMLTEYKNNKNPYMNYEYMMLDISRQYSLNYIKIDNLLWHEIDSKDHYDYINTKLLKKIKRKEESLFLESLKDIVCECMEVTADEVDNISAIGGMTNSNYKIVVNGSEYVLRVPGIGTEDMISRTEEIRIARYANEIGVDAELIYFNEVTGVKISRFIENAETLTEEGSKKQHVMEMVCEILNTLHSSIKPMNSDFDIFGKFELYEEILISSKGKFFDDYYEVKADVLKLKEISKSLDVKLTPCHNDTLAANFIRSGEDKLYLIDWEYGGMNDPMWDLAAHCLENNFSEDEEELFLNIYFGGKVEEKFKKRILINKIYQDFLWSTWTNIKEAEGDDFGTYGIDRYNRAKKFLKEIL